MIYSVIVKTLFLVGFALGLFSIGKILWLFLEMQVSKAKDYFNELRFIRRQPFIKTHVHTITDYSNIFGLSFGTQVILEQDYYLNAPVGDSRLVFKKRIFAPELCAEKWGPQLVSGMLKSFFTF